MNRGAAAAATRIFRGAAATPRLRRRDQSGRRRYHNIHGLKSVGLRFFTVYGPWGRPDMAVSLFTNKIENGETITLFNGGEMWRDFTYRRRADIPRTRSPRSRGVFRGDGDAATPRPRRGYSAEYSVETATRRGPDIPRRRVARLRYVDDIVDGIERSMEYCSDNAAVFNLGNSKPVKLGYFLAQIEQRLGVKAKFKYQASNAEIKETYADVSKAKELLGYAPKTSIEDGLDSFMAWYKKLDKPTRDEWAGGRFKGGRRVRRRR